MAPLQDTACLTGLGTFLGPSDPLTSGCLLPQPPVLCIVHSPSLLPAAHAAVLVLPSCPGWVRELLCAPLSLCFPGYSLGPPPPFQPLPFLGIPSCSREQTRSGPGLGLPGQLSVTRVPLPLQVPMYASGEEVAIKLECVKAKHPQLHREQILQDDAGEVRSRRRGGGRRGGALRLCLVHLHGEGPGTGGLGSDGA